MNYTRIFLTSAVALYMVPCLMAQGNLTLPDESPKAMVMHRAGITDITVEYYSPSVKGRTIWGELVPYDQVWRCGANQNTTFTCSTPVTVEGQTLPAGCYGLHMIPTEKQWTVIFSKNHTSWGSFFYRQEEDALRVTVTPRTGEHTEWLNYTFTDRKGDDAVLELQWEKLRIPVRIHADVVPLTVANIKNELRNMPGFTWMGWYQGAKYLAGHNTELNQALKWIDVSVSMEPNFTNLELKSRILSLKGDQAAADQVMQQAMKMANENQLNMYGYRLLQSNRTTDAIEVFKLNVKLHPESWNVYDSLGEGYATAGDKTNAIKNYKIALEKAPQERKPVIEQILKKLQG